MKRSSLLTAVAIIAIAAGAAVLAVRGKAPEVTLARVARGTAVEAIYATGTVEPVNMAEIRPVVTGRIAAFAADEGQQVKASQPLARLDEDEARAKIDELSARAGYWREEANRQRILAGQGVASKDTAARAQSEARQAEAALAASRQRLEDVVLIAPFDGLVLRREGEVGEVVDNKRTLFWIGQGHPLRISAEVDEEDIPRVRVGQIVLVRSDAFADQAFKGRVEQITPKGDPLTKTFRVRVSLPDDVPLMAGMTAELNIVVREVTDALIVPATAVVDGKVFVVSDDVAHARPVKSGIVGRRATEIIDGLKDGEAVVAEPPKKLGDGDRVRLAG